MTERGHMKPILILTFLALLGLVGCAALDQGTGVNDPDVIAGTKTSSVEQLGETLDSALPFPWSLIAGGVLGYGAKIYRDVRLAQKAKEAEATPPAEPEATA